MTGSVERPTTERDILRRAGNGGTRTKEPAAMAESNPHDDVIVVGSGFGGSVAALPATEKGYRVGVTEAGKRWPDEEIPYTSLNEPSSRSSRQRR
jgi:alkyl hydroperoxide reductase subunit AhpF